MRSLARSASVSRMTAPAKPPLPELPTQVDAVTVAQADVEDDDIDALLDSARASASRASDAI